MPRLRELLRYPLAVPPVSRNLVARLAPEIYALAVWAVFLWIWRRDGTGLRQGVWESLGLAASRFTYRTSPGMLSAALSRAAAIACELAGPVMLLAPVPLAARAFADEREAGTLEALLLTSTHHEHVVRGRFISMFLPWLRLAGWLLPIYLLAACEPLFTYNAAGWSPAWLSLLGRLLWPGTAGGFVWQDAVTPGPSRHTIFLAVMRFAHDASGMVLIIGAAFFISLRARTALRSILWSFAAVAPLTAVFNCDLIWLVATRCAGRILAARPVQWYWLVALAVMAARWGAVWSMLNRVARNFDAYVLREQPDSGRPRIRLRSAR